MRPCGTTRSCVGSAPAPARVSSSSQWVVARRPSSSPAAPSSSEPVQTDVVQHSVGGRALYRTISATGAAGGRAAAGLGARLVREGEESSPAARPSDPRVKKCMTVVRFLTRADRPADAHTATRAASWPQAASMSRPRVRRTVARSPRSSSTARKAAIASRLEPSKRPVGL
jgi:hypothetical protein